MRSLPRCQLSSIRLQRQRDPHLNEHRAGQPVRRRRSSPALAQSANPHRDRRTLGPHLPRLRAWALLRRRPAHAAPPSCRRPASSSGVSSPTSCQKASTASATTGCSPTASAPTASPRPESCSPCPHRSPSRNRGNTRATPSRFTHTRVPPAVVVCSSSRSSRVVRSHHGEAQVGRGRRRSSAGSTRHDRASLRHPHRGQWKSLANCRHRSCSRNSKRSTRCAVCRGAS